jgi:lysozyme
MVQSGEVIAINLTDDDFSTTYAITVRLTPNNQEAIAYPLNANIKRVPLVGESVIIVPATLAEGNSTKTVSRLYYLDVISIQQNIHHNALPTVAGVPITTQGGDYGDTSAGNPNSEGGESAAAGFGDGFVERTDVGSLQPFLGDLLIEGRFGHSLRFGYSPEGADTTEDPSWNSSTPEDPITILSNGRKPAGSYNKFIIENVDEDLSSIWLTSSQKVKLSVSNKLPSDVDAQSQFDKPSVILNSDRIILNSKSDWVVLSGAKSVALTTPSWAMDMDKLFTIIEGLIQQVADLTSAKATFATGVGPTGPATNVADVTKLLTDLKKMGGSSTPPPSSAAAAAGRAGAGSSVTAAALWTANESNEDDEPIEDSKPIEDPEHAAVPHFPVSSMSISSNGVDFIKRKEGFRTNAYQDSVGVWTIGYGTTAAALGREIGRNETVSKAQATQYLLEHLENSYSPAVKRYVKSTVTQGEFDAMVSFTYNLGSGSFKKSTLLKKFNAGDHFGAAMEFLKWDKAGGKKLAGLTKRRKEEQEIFLA